MSKFVCKMHDINHYNDDDLNHHHNDRHNHNDARPVQVRRQHPRRVQRYSFALWLCRKRHVLLPSFGMPCT